MYNVIKHNDMRNFNWQSICWMLFVCLLSAGCTEEAEDMFGSVLGKVTDAQTGEVIQGATVQLTPGGMSRTTGSDGTYEFAELEAGQYQLQVTKADYVTNSKSITVVVGKSVTGDIALTPVKRLELSASALNFGKDNNSLSFDILNKGTSKFNWNISGLGDADWIEVNPASGALEGGKSCAVQVTVLRDKLTENKELSLIVNADKETAALKITAEAARKTAKVEIEPSVLDFGVDEGVLTFNIKNTGNAGSVDWNITGLDVDWISITPMKGTLEQDKTQAVKVTLARALVKEHMKTTVLINAAGESVPLEITADEKKERYIVADPLKMELGEKESGTLTLLSYYGSTSYMLSVKETGISWLTLSKTSGTIPQFDAANPAMKETVEVSVSRTGLEAGDYSCTLVVRSDLADLEVPVTMTVKESGTKLEVEPKTIDFGQEKATATFTLKNVGNTGAFDWTIPAPSVDWLTATPLSGTLAMGKTATVTLSLDRSKLTVAAGTSITVNGGGESVQVTVSADVKPQREFKVQPSSLAVGTAETASFTMYSNHGATSYQLLTKENVAWLTFSKATGTVAEDGMETIQVKINRESLAAGNYQATIIVRTDLGDTEIPVSMTVEAAAAVGDGKIISCSDDLEFTLGTCKLSGTTATIEFTVKNIGKGTTTLKFYGGYFADTYAYDDQGNKYVGYDDFHVALAGTETGNYVETNLPADVFVKGYLKIKNVADKAALFSSIHVRTNMSADLVFENISIEGRSASALPAPQVTGEVVSCSDDLEFTLLECKRNTSSVAISFRVKNIGKATKSLKLYGGYFTDTYAYDNQGNKYSGDKTIFVNLCDIETSNYVETALPSNVFCNGRLVIKDVDEAISTFSNITVRTNQADLLVFKNLEIR